MSKLYKSLFFEPFDDFMEVTLTIRTADHYRASVAFDNFMNFSFFTIDQSKTLFHSLEDYAKHKATTDVLFDEVSRCVAIIKQSGNSIKTKEEIEQLFEAFTISIG